MANDVYLIQGDTLRGIAGAIRAKTGSTEALTPQEMQTEVEENIKDALAELLNGTLTEYSSDKVTSMSIAFPGGSTPLASVSMPNLQVIPSKAFSGKRVLRTVSFPRAESVGDSAFRDCGLRSVDLPAATSIGSGAFYDCSGLTAISLPAATSIGSTAFQRTALATIDMPKVENIGAFAFNGQTALTIVDLPAVTRIDEAAFGGCSGITHLVLRSEEAVTLGVDNDFNEAAYIYRPASIIESEKTATNWSARASQFRVLEDYTVDGTITGALDETKI